MKFYASILAALLLLSSAAFAAPPAPTIGYTPGTKCSDNTTDLTKCVTTGYKVYYGLNGQPKNASISVGPGITSTLVPVPTAGNWCFDVTALWSGGESVHSLTAPCQSVVDAQIAPGAPTNVTITVQVVDNAAYKLRQGLGTVQFVKIGTVPVGTVCDSSHNFDGFSLIDRNAIVPASKFDTLPVITFAKCG